MNYDQPTEFPSISFCSIQPHLYDTDLPFVLCDSHGSNPENNYESFISAYNGRCFHFNSGRNMDKKSIQILEKNTTHIIYRYMLLMVSM